MKKTTPFLLLALFCLQGCAPVAIVGAGTVGGFSMAQDRGIGGTMTDKSIESRMKLSFIRHERTLYDNLIIDSYNRRVLLLGKVATPEMKKRALDLAKEVTGIREILDEIIVSPDTESIPRYLKDTKMTSKVKMNLVKTKGVHAINYHIHTLEQKVFVLGMASSWQELEKVLNVIRHLPDVKEVINYVEITTPHVSSEAKR